MILERLQFLAPFFAPPQCEACEKASSSEQWLCDSCENQIKFLPKNHCTKCAEPFSVSESTPHLCGECLKISPSFSKVWAAYLYEGSLPSLIHLAKLKHRPFALLKLAKQSDLIFKEALKEFQPDFITPMPLSFWRSLKRGYNQSYLLAKAWLQSSEKILSGKQEEKITLKLVAKRHHTKPLAQQKREERLKMLQHAFRVNVKAVQDKRILLIDDVMTTGATIQALSLALKKAGATEVGVCVLARTAKWS